MFPHQKLFSESTYSQTCVQRRVLTVLLTKKNKQETNDTFLKQQN